MARQIIVLDRLPNAALAFRVAYWPAVPVARQPFYANTEATSQFKDATQAEIDALKAGSVVEVVETASFVPGTTVNAIKAALVTRFGQVQAVVNGTGQWQYYGTSYVDGAWVDSGA